MAVSILTLASITLLLTWVARKLLDTSARNKGSYPPGPKLKPLIGNMLDFPAADSAKVFMEWEKKYNSQPDRSSPELQLLNSNRSFTSRRGFGEPRSCGQQPG